MLDSEPADRRRFSEGDKLLLLQDPSLRRGGIGTNYRG
jgi:hypothetical protein